MPPRRLLGGLHVPLQLLTTAGAPGDVPGLEEWWSGLGRGDGSHYSVGVLNSQVAVIRPWSLPSRESALN